MKCEKCGYESPIQIPASGQGIAVSMSGEKGGFKIVGSARECPMCGFKNQQK
jgi:rubredoxin